MADLSRLEVVLADVVATIKRIPGVVGVHAEAPREDETPEVLKPSNVPVAYVWELDEEPAVGSTSAFQCDLPVMVELVYPFSLTDSSQGLRTRGRQWKAKIQEALMVDPGRGFDEGNNVRNAFDTLERSNVIGPTTAAGYGCVHLEYVVTYQRSIANPYRAAA